MPVASPYAAQLAAVPVRERSLEVLGTTTKYWVYGPDDASVTIVAVHGYRGEHHGLEPVIAQLADVRVISPDLPGFGESGAFPEARHDIPGYSSWLRAFVAALDLPDVVVLGHSFGSIVVSAAIADGLAPRRVILINPIAAPALSGPNAVLSRLTLAYYRAGQALPARIGTALLASPVIVRFMSQVMVETKDVALRRWIHDQHHRYFSHYATRDSVVEGFEASISSDVSQFAARVSAPTLLIAAERDPISTVEAQRGLAELFDDVTLVVIPAVGHLIHYERPRHAAEAIVSFLGAGSLAPAHVEGATS